MSLPSGCRSWRSVQREINNLISKEYTDWAVKIQDTATREEMRKKIIAVSTEPWCDSRAGTCGCKYSD